MKYVRISILIPLLVLFASPVLAQFDGPPPDGKARERLEELRRLKMIEALKLDEEQAVRLTVREREFRESERELMEQRKDQIDAMRKLIEDKADDAALQAALDKLNDLSLTVVKKRQEYVLSLRDILSMEQVVRLVIFEHRFAEEVKRILSNARRKPMRR